MFYVGLKCLQKDQVYKENNSLTSRHTQLIVVASSILDCNVGVCLVSVVTWLANYEDVPPHGTTDKKKTIQKTTTSCRSLVSWSIIS